MLFGHAALAVHSQGGRLTPLRELAGVCLTANGGKEC